jgi:hypothetical protein
MMNLGRKTNSSIKQSQFSYCVFPSFFFWDRISMCHPGWPQ